MKKSKFPVLLVFFAIAIGISSVVNLKPAHACIVLPDGSSTCSGRIAAGLYRLPDGTFISANDSGAFCRFVSPAHFEFLSGRYDLVQSVDSSEISAMANHGACAVRLPAGAYRLVDGRIIASNGSAFCRYVSYEHYERKDGRPIRGFNGEIPLHAMENHFDCAQ